MSRASSPLRGKMIFAVGARRSGTNWLQRVLEGHPKVAAVPSETSLFSLGLTPLSERFHHGALSSSQTGAVYVDRDTMLDAMRDLCDAVFTGLMAGLSPHAERLVERTPDHVRYLSLIGDVYPDAHIVHIIRDGRDVVRSLLSQEWGPTEVTDAALEWRSAIEAARRDAAGLENYHEVRYEQLFSDPRTQITALFSELGLSTGEASLDPVFGEFGFSFNADPSSSGIKVAKWRTELTPETVQRIEDAVGTTLDELGYERSGPQRTVAKTPAKRSVRERIRRTRRTQPSLRNRQEIGQRTLDRFLEAVRRDPKSVTDLLASNVRVRIVDGDLRVDARGEEAVRRLVDELIAEEPMHGPQVVGYIHPSVPTATFAGEFEKDGRRYPRVVVLTIVGGMIDRVAYYRFPSR